MGRPAIIKRLVLTLQSKVRNTNQPSNQIEDLRLPRC